MFTGIISDLGEIIGVTGEGERHFKISCAYDVDTIDLGASIACNGCCLTVTDKGTNEGRAWFSVTVSSETLSKTNLGSWVKGTKINLERSLRHGDELGGHLVSGHVDGLAVICDKQQDGSSIKYIFEGPQELMKYIAPKGSIALNGTSLTVNQVEATKFEVMMIPHTLSHTIWGIKELTTVGTKVNLEIDMLARYAEKLSANMNK